jgi:benzoyl-CoA reductase/2-hydroxyglutaryl-CoA dehydratase subunit BcrC/BadD/HgdB
MIPETAQPEARPLLGFLTAYVPEELFHAAGFTPVFIFHTPQDHGHARAHLPGFTCWIAGSALDQALAGELDDLAGMALAQTCDTVQGLTDLWRRNVSHIPLFHFGMPLRLDGPAARAYLLAELHSLRERVQALSGHPITDDALRHSIALYNHTRALVRRLYAHTSPPPIPPKGGDEERGILPNGRNEDGGIPHKRGNEGKGIPPTRRDSSVLHPSGGDTSVLLPPEEHPSILPPSGGHLSALPPSGGDRGGAPALYRLIRAAFQKPKETYNQTLEHHLQSATQHSPSAICNPQFAVSNLHSPPSPPRLLLSGPALADPILFDILAQSGAHVVGDLLDLGERYFAVDIPEDDAGDPIAALADRLLALVPTPTKHHPWHTRAAHLLSLVRERRADGVVFARQKFCEPHGFDYVQLAHALDRAGVPHLLVELEQASQAGQLRTRVEAFVEMIGQPQVP